MLCNKSLWKNDIVLKNGEFEKLCDQSRFYEIHEILMNFRILNNRLITRIFKVAANFYRGNTALQFALLWCKNGECFDFLPHPSHQITKRLQATFL